MTRPLNTQSMGLPDALRTDLTDVRSTAGHTQFLDSSMAGGLRAMHCMGCNRWRSPERSKVRPVLGRICAECVDAREAKKQTRAAQ